MPLHFARQRPTMPEMSLLLRGLGNWNIPLVPEKPRRTSAHLIPAIPRSYANLNSTSSRALTFVVLIPYSLLDDLPFLFLFLLPPSLGDRRQSVAIMLHYRTQGYNGCAVKYSPFFDNRLAVASSSNFGLVGNGRLHILELTANGIQPLKW